MTKARPGSLVTLVACLLGLALLAGALVVGAALMQSSMNVVRSRPSDAERELDAIVAGFEGQRPYVDVERRDGVLAVVVHHELEPATPARIVTLHAVLWDTPNGRIVRASTPQWVFSVTRWKTRAAGTLIAPLEKRIGLEARLPDLVPFGRGLVLDHHAADGSRIVIWADGDEPR